MKITIEITTDNQAFVDNFKAELARVLGTVVEKVAEQVCRPRKSPECICHHPEDADLLRDHNGNRCGTVKVWL